jgi:hypothetical protein
MELVRNDIGVKMAGDRDVFEEQAGEERGKRFYQDEC